MASPSTDQEALTLSLPADLAEWLDERATQLDVDREAVMVQLLASYRAAAELDGDGESPPIAGVEAVAEAVERELDGELDAVRGEFEERVDAIEADYTDKIEDVRDRIIQVKKETDQKAPADHSHPELDGVIDRVDALENSIDSLADRVDAVEASVGELETSAADREATIEDLAERFETVQDRLQTVAWVVNDLRDGDDRGAVERIKRAAATADVDRAKCERCGNGVDIALLTEPECPHCQATVTDVEPAAGFFSKPRLRAASQLESGDGR